MTLISGVGSASLHATDCSVASASSSAALGSEVLSTYLGACWDRLLQPTISRDLLVCFHRRGKLTSLLCPDSAPLPHCCCCNQIQAQLLKAPVLSQLSSCIIDEQVF